MNEFPVMAINSDFSDPFSESFVEGAIDLLGDCSLPKSLNPEDHGKSVKEVLWSRLNNVKNFQSFDSWVPPAKVRNRIKKNRDKIKDALQVLRSLKCNNEIKKDKSEDEEQTHLERKYLFQASNLNGVLSGGLIGYDIINFDKNFSTAVESLEEIEVYFDAAFAEAESRVKGRGGSKPEKNSPDLILFCLADIYKAFTGEEPKISVNEETGESRGKFVKFLEYVLPHTPYPYEATHWALEKRIRGLKSHKVYGQLWIDAK